MAWRMVHLDLAGYLLAVGSVPSVLPLPGRVSFESYFHNFKMFFMISFFSRMFYMFLI